MTPLGAKYSTYLADPFPVEAKPGTAKLAGPWRSADWLTATFASHAANGEMAELRCLSSRTPKATRALIRTDQPVQVIQNSDNAILFSGVITKSHFKYDGQATEFQVIAYNTADFFLHRTVLHGQARFDAANEQKYFSNPPTGEQPMTPDTDFVVIDTPLCFNPNGEANATDSEFYNASGANNQTYRIFEVPGRQQVNSPPQQNSWASLGSGNCPS